MKKKFLIIGGDTRNFYLYEELKKENYDVDIVGFLNFSEEINSHKETNLFGTALIKNYDVIVTAIPNLDDKYLYMPFNDSKDSKIEIVKLLNEMNKNQIYVSGKINDKTAEILNAKEIKYIDISEDESFALKNAVPTAEGAICVAIENTSKTFKGREILILGFGRIGEYLAKISKSLGANVTVATKSAIHSKISKIKSYGFTPIYTEDIKNYVNGFDIIFNTIPFVYLEKAELELMKNDVLIIELASKPYGVDFDEAQKQNKKVISASGLPGKVAPCSVAVYIKDIILQILSYKKTI